MREGWSGWTRRLLAGGLVAGAALLTVGCGTYEPEPEYPQVQYVQAPPPSATDLQTQQQQREAETGSEVALGVDANAEDADYPDTDPSALTEFKPVLEGHGRWVDDSTYGTVWVPAEAEVGTDFQPYVSAGHWTYSDDSDYVWVSDYSWGWAPFHYGRWVTLPGYGWSWIPGRRYSGAWVSWRYGAGYDYVGWAPMAPSWYWYGGSAYGWGFGGYDYRSHYSFCDRGHLYGGSSYVVRGPAAQAHMGRTVDYVPARPTVNGPSRVVARPTVGPRPSELGNGGVVVAPPRNNVGMARATAFATPRTAVSVGAAPPAHLASRAPASNAMVPRTTANAAVATGPRYTDGPGGRAPVRSISAAPTVSGPVGGMSQGPRTVASPSFSGGSRIPSVASPARSQPVVRAAPSVESRSPSSFSSRPSPMVRSAPSMAAPSVRSSPSPSVRSAPSMRSASPSVSRSVGGGGGGRSFSGGGGGGRSIGGGSVRSSGGGRSGGSRR